MGDRIKTGLMYYTALKFQRFKLDSTADNRRRHTGRMEKFKMSAGPRFDLFL